MTQTGSNQQFEATAWLDDVAEILQESAWSEALHSEGIDFLDALQTQLLYAALQLTRSVDAEANKPDRSLIENVKRLVESWGYQARVRMREKKSLQSSTEATPAAVLFWPQMSTHIKQLFPITEQLRMLGASTACLFNRPQEFMLVRNQQPNTAFVVGAWSDTSGRVKGKIAKCEGILLRDPGVKLPSPNPRPRDETILEAIRAVLIANCATAHNLIYLAQIAIARLKPHTLVVGNDITVEGRIQSIIARKAGVLTVCPMHGIIAGKPLQGRHVADAVFVYGENSRRELIGLGEEPERIHVCGAAHLTNRPRQTNYVHPPIREFLNLPDDAPGCCWQPRGRDIASRSNIIAA